MRPVRITSAADAKYILARAWHSKGRLAAAIRGYREALELDPGHGESAVLLVSLLKSQQRLEEALAICRQGLEHNPNDARLRQEMSNLAPIQDGVKGDEVACASSGVVFPKIEASRSNHRPFWSVIVSVYRRTAYLEQALRSVLSQAPGPDEMQIEIVADYATDSVQSQIEAIVRRTAGGRVHLYRSSDHVGQPEIFNIALRLARGSWIHMLHDDDWVGPGFYQALSRAIAHAPEIGAAFCRHAIVGPSQTRLSFLERETSGVIENWLERIACSCRLAPPSIVVRREAYERLGGYCPQAKSAFDWEMWQRLAVHYPIWFEPSPLAFFRENGESETARLTATGEQIAHSRAAIEIAETYLPAEKKSVLSRRARENYALRAFERARLHLSAGDSAAARANIKEGLRCNPSEVVRDKLCSLLAGAIAAQEESCL